MAKVLISGYYGFKNFGDEAVLSVLTKHLNALKFDVTVLSGNVDYTEKYHNVRAVNSFDIKTVIDEIKKCDLLISGGGSLLQDVTSLKSLVYYAFIISLGLLFNKKVVIFAQGIGPLNRKVSQIIVKNLLKLCSYVSVRDKNSLEILQKWGINADLVCDPVYSLEVEKKDCKGTLGVQLRDFKTLDTNFLQKLALFINAKFSDKNVEIFSLQDSLDYDVCKKFENILLNINPEIQISVINTNITEKISELEYLIAMRFHSILVALKAGVKTCAINYDIKVEQLAKSAGIPLISMNTDENFERIYSDLINLNSKKLADCDKSFDWENFDTTVMTAF